MELPEGDVHVSAIPMIDDGRSSASWCWSTTSASSSGARRPRGASCSSPSASSPRLASVVTIVAARLSWRGWSDELRRLLRGGGPSGPSSSRSCATCASWSSAWRREGESRRRGRRVDAAAAQARRWSRHLHGERVVIVANREPYIHERDAGRAGRGAPPGQRPGHRARAGDARLLGRLGRARQRLGRSRDRRRARPRARAAGRGVVRAAPGVADARGGAGLLLRLLQRGAVAALPHRAHAADLPQRGLAALPGGQPAASPTPSCEEVDSDDPIILVQDYHFALAPALIRERLPRATIITFWHIPWPNAERFGICPWRDELLEGLLGSEHRRLPHPARTATTSSTRSTASSRRASIASRTRSCSSGRTHAGAPLPDLDRVAGAAGLTGAARRASAGRSVFARARAARRTRCSASASIASTTPRASRSACWRSSGCSSASRSCAGASRFVQLAAPSRTAIERYRQLNEQRRGSWPARINERFGDGALPARSCCCARTTSRPTVFRYYRAADLCYVSSLHDGMNLVAKEFVAARDDERGVLVLSQFTGAARELTEALIVNPYDLDEASAALARRADACRADEQRDRMRVDARASSPSSTSTAGPGACWSTPRGCAAASGSAGRLHAAACSRRGRLQRDEAHPRRRARERARAASPGRTCCWRSTSTARWRPSWTIPRPRRAARDDARAAGAGGGALPLRRHLRARAGATCRARLRGRRRCAR